MRRYSAVTLAVLSLAAISPGGHGDALAADGVGRGSAEPGMPPAGQGQPVEKTDAAGSAGTAAARPVDLSPPPEALEPPTGPGPAPTPYRGLPGLRGVQDDPIATMRRALPGLLDAGNDDNQEQVA